MKLQLATYLALFLGAGLMSLLAKWAWSIDKSSELLTHVILQLGVAKDPERSLWSGYILL
jgi:hypothetical protein